MPWWGWLAVGAALLAAEAAVQTEFWLALIGAGALTLGAALWLFGFEVPVWGQWLAFAALSIAYIFVFRRSILDRWVGSAPGMGPELIGEAGVAIARIAPGAVGQVALRGTTWKARNTGAAAVNARAAVQVTGRAGILLEIQGEEG